MPLIYNGLEACPELEKYLVIECHSTGLLEVGGSTEGSGNVWVLPTGKSLLL